MRLGGYRGWFLVALITVSFLLAGAGACDRAGSKSDESATNGSDAPKEQTEEENDEPPPSKGDDCSVDSDCQRYLRCIDEICSIPPAITGEANENTPRVSFRGADAGESDEPIATFQVELATTVEQRRRGLMFRESMRDDWGMLFVYPDEQPRSFWMKNTYIPLDMIFIDGSGKVVRVIASAEPRTTTPRPSGKPARFVLELNAGRAEEVGIEQGAVMSVDNVPDEHAPRP